MATKKRGALFGRDPGDGEHITNKQDPRDLHAKKSGHGLGRVAAMDERDRKHTMTTVLKRTAVPQKANSWRVGAVLDQGQAPHCVGFSWAQFLRTAPMQTTTGLARDPSKIYHEAQKLDEWPGENYDGTSVRAGAKVLQAAGNIVEYLWSWNVEEVAAWIAQFGPVVVGTNWYDGMFKPDKSGLLTISGAIAGGHAWTLYGQDPKAKVFRMINSWGTDWGIKGKAIIGWDSMQRLFDELGEAVTTKEVALKKK